VPCYFGLVATPLSALLLSGVILCTEANSEWWPAVMALQERDEELDTTSSATTPWVRADFRGYGILYSVEI